MSNKEALAAATVSPDPVAPPLCPQCERPLGAGDSDVCLDCALSGEAQVQATMMLAEARMLRFGEETTTWAPQSLDEILAGDYMPPAPTMVARVDGRCLLYTQRSHTVSAEPEALKTWLALYASSQELTAGHVVIYIDFESNPAEIAGRLRALGVDVKVIRDCFVYIRPDEPLTERSLADLDAVLERRPTLAVIDGVTEAYTVQGLSPLDNSDVAKWLELLPRRLVRAGAATLQLDHVVKDREARGRFALGAQHKLAGVDVAYSLHVVEPFGRGRDGVVTVKVQKDRPGGVREFAEDGVICTLRAASHEDGHVSLSLDPPRREDGARTFRPTALMEKASRAIEETPGLTSRGVRSAIRGRAEYVSLALELLVAEGYVRGERGPHDSRLHHSLRPYRQEEDMSGSRPVPDRFPEPVGGTGSHDRPLKGPSGAGTGRGPLVAADRFPDQEHAERLWRTHRGGKS